MQYRNRLRNHSSNFLKFNVAIEELENDTWKVFYRNVFLGYFNEKQTRSKQRG
ncbi:hypothetical protein [Aquimarina longa]|uniref:hypothetical protein n=1 Tax=Aquimarina longa TaxID=1080221 RepID=UPI00130E9779|nr:hypothetical protein [Aquimarina longa]